MANDANAVHVRIHPIRYTGDELEHVRTKPGERHEAFGVYLELPTGPAPVWIAAFITLHEAAIFGGQLTRVIRIVENCHV